MADTEEIVLGSGKVYIAEFTGTLPEAATLAVDTNLLGLIKGGASITYKPTFYEAKDDLGLKTETVITDEEAIFKTGLITWDGNTLKKLCATGRVTETATLRTVKIGGIANNDGKSYVLLFVHTDTIKGDTRIFVVGKNTAGFALSFLKDKETVLDAEFKASPQDNEGTLIKYEKVIPAA